MTSKIRVLRWAMTGAAAIAVVSAGAAHAQEAAPASATETRAFDVPAQPLAQAAIRFSEQAGVQLVLDAGVTEGVSGSAVSGELTVAQAVQQLLAGTGLSWRWLNARTITIEGPPGANGERVLGAVRVEGAQGSPYFGGAGQAAGVNGVNGSRDITATEGTGSFTSGALTIGSKVPQAMKDVPQSLSVLTSERMEQQNVTDFTTALKQLPGITLVQGQSSLENTFYSRGFAITSIQVDGGAPIQTGTYQLGSTGYFPQIDMSVYDHVELLRGATGLFNGYGSPSGSVNLVRKKPLDHAQLSIEGQAGSWDNYRVVVDATSPLTRGGALRGRLVMTYQDQHYFYDNAQDNKALLYGITELDATPTTLVTAGISHTRQNSVPWRGGLPRYESGDDIGLPRSTSFVFRWNRWDFDTTEFFGGIEQRLGEEWNIKLNLTHNRQQSLRKVGYGSGSVNPNNNLGPLLNGSYNDYESEQFSAEAVLTGAFELFGQRQEITLGANRVNSDASGQFSYPQLITSSTSAPYQPYPGGPLYCTNISICPSGLRAPRIDVFAFDPTDFNYTEPRNPLPTARYRAYGQIQSVAYLNLRLTALDRLHLTTGLRWSRYEHKVANEALCTTATGACAGKQVGDVNFTDEYFYHDNDLSWPPSANLSFDVSRDLTVYVGYTDIYISQADKLDFNSRPIDPITGSNWEAGVKWAPRDGRLNLSFAAYKITQENFGIIDGFYDNETGEFVASNGERFPNFGDIDGVHSCCFKADPNEVRSSKGIDIEATGEVLPGWQVSANYTYNKNEFARTAGPLEGTPLTSIQPKHLYKLWTSYDFEAAGHHGPLSRLAISGGLNGQSSAYIEGTGCRPEFIVTNPVTGAASCGSGGSFTYAFTVPAYVILSGRLDYRISEKWSLTVNVENILDKTYYQTVGSALSGNWYGAPRSATISLRARW